MFSLVRCLAIIIVAASMFTIGCGGSSSDGDGGLSKLTPGYVSFADNWRGTLIEATSGSFGEVTLTLQQSDETLTGSWNAKFNSGTVNGGLINGVVHGNDTVVDFQLTGSLCPLSVTASVLSDEAIGNYTSVNCPILLAGSLHVYRDGGATPYNPPLPTQPTGVVATTGHSQVTLQWSKVAGASSHNVYWSASAGVTTSTGTQQLQVSLPATITGLTNGTPYYFIVTANNASGEGPASIEVNATPLGSATNAPINVIAQAAYEQATITWPAVSGSTGYNLYWGTTSGQAFSTGTKVMGVTSGYVLNGLTNGTTYYLAVTSTNASGESAPSGEAFVTPYESIKYDFDNTSLQGWTPTGFWSVVSTDAHSGSYAVTDSPNGHYANDSNSWLQSPQIDLAGSNSPALTFWHRYVIESGYDKGYVEISTNWGTSWTALRSYTGTQSSWTAQTISLAAYSGSTVLIRFRLESDYIVTYDGWYLDDIVISR